jgi:hypothetical protein
MPNGEGGLLAVYTDLLLHHLGAEGAGRIGDEFASTGEWRTAPLMDLDRQAPLSPRRRRGRPRSGDPAPWRRGRRRARPLSRPDGDGAREAPLLAGAALMKDSAGEEILARGGAEGTRQAKGSADAAGG